MSKREPDCPLYNHAHCRYVYDPKMCVIVREDKKCLKPKMNKKKKYFIK